MPPPFDLLPALLSGLWVTVQITLGGAVLAFFCAFVGGVGRLSRDIILRGLARIYIEVFRGTSALVQLFWFYFALPLLVGVKLSAVAVGILVLGLNVGAYGAEVVRGALQSIPEVQIQAAIALNLSRWQRLRYVILPQALRMMLPPFGNLLIELLKGTALVSMIAATDLTRAGLFVRDHTHRTAEVFGLLLLLYFAMAQLIALFVRWLERRLSAHLPKEHTS